MLANIGESRYIEIDGINTHYVVAGEGRPVLLIHGLGASMVVWRENIAALAERFRVYAIDLPGHGDTDKPDIEYDAESNVEFLRGFVESLGVGQIAMVGNSLGGALALMTALAHPEIVSKLALVSSGSLGREVSIWLRLPSLPIVGKLMTMGPIDSTGFMLRKALFDKSLATPELITELRRTNSLPGAREAVSKIIRNFISLWGVRRRYVRARDLGRLEMPLLIIWGAEDRMIPPKHAYRAARANSRVDLHVFSSCGHMPQLERATEFNGIALEFLSE
ncbi:MAG: alpha/beta fold hydrolase [Chloroflexi bacterium]|nr:alpha/beta fold hydrolase [Chloroflexota bacterium]